MMEVMDSMLPRTANTRNVRDMRQSRRALELRKFFAPAQFKDPEALGGFNASINNDGALDAYVETVLWRLRGTHAMVSLVDRETQYFITGATRQAGVDDDLIVKKDDWFGCSNVNTPGGLCENTLTLKNTTSNYPCFIIQDLSKDKRFASLPVVDGSVASYRFYAGTPITTNQGVNIGTLFLFDERPRSGLAEHQRKFLSNQATNIMRHLESKREAAERRRVALMSKGIASFLERTMRRKGDVSSSSDGSVAEAGTYDVVDDDADGIAAQAHEAVNVANDSISNAKSSVLDQIRKTLDDAADILRESLELVVGGVVFLDPTIGYSETGHNEAYLDASTDLGQYVEGQEAAETEQNNSTEDIPPSELTSAFDDLYLASSTVRSSVDKHKPAKVQAMSAAQVATWDPESKVLDGKTLQTLINSYPNGNVWYMDDEGYFSSLEQMQVLKRNYSSLNRSVSPTILTKQRAEAIMLSKIFHDAKQIIFLPLWDAGGDRWYSGVFVWSQSAVPVFTVDSEIAYLSAFTNSVMVEISRLDAITANKMKSDFISSISHEFRSPLHAILASAEFLRDSKLDVTQLEFVSTIQNCGGTLLDTMNHVLDYSKINSFNSIEKSGNSKESTGISNELFQVANLALLCEDLINGMIAGSEYSELANGHRDPALNQYSEIRSRLAIVLDVETRNWDFTIQAGALRRIVMNIFGNAQKYTDKGFIQVKLRVQDSSSYEGKESTPSGKFLRLNIRDSGRGMSSEYMERKLYHPFAQEDSFATGVGLGLSIVWSIVNQLGGKIHVRSELGKGTDVEVTLPLEKAEEPEGLSIDAPDSVFASVDGSKVLSTLRERAAGKSISILQNTKPGAAHKDVFWECIVRYCKEWYGFEIKPSGGDIIVTDELDMEKHNKDSKIVMVHKGMICPIKRDPAQSFVIDICCPVGPFKLAKIILELLDRQHDAGSFSHRADAGTQTPAGSPEERKILDGIILTDYGFPLQSLREVLARDSESSSNVSTPPTATSTNPAPAEDETVNTPGTWALRLPEAVRSKSLSPRRIKDPTASPDIPPRDSSLQSFINNPPNQVKPSSPPRSSSPQPPPREPLLQPSIATPQTQPQSAPLPEPSSTPTSPPTSLQILAVDDNAVNLQLLKRFLQKRTADTILTARDGFEAVNAYKTALTNPNPALKTFDVVFMDISMPGMDGFEATRVIRKLEAEREKSEQEKVRRAYVVALTGLASRRDRDEAVESGLDDFLTKPVSFKRIGELLGRLEREKIVRCAGVGS